MSEPWLTKLEVAAELRVSRATVERMKLPHMRVGRQNRYLMSQVYAAINGTMEREDNVIPLRPRPKERAA